MSAIWVVVGVVVGAIVLIVLPMVLVLGYFLATKSKTRRMAAEQYSLDKKTGAGTSKRDDQDGKNGYTIKYFWSVLLVLVGGALVYWGLDTQVRPVDVGSWSSDKWFPLLVLWGVLAGLIALNAKALGATAKTLQWVTGGVMLALLIAFPLWSWVVGPTTPQRGTRSEVPLASSPQSEWPKLVIPAGVGVRSEFIRYSPEMSGKHIVMYGSNFRLHTVYQDGRECTFGEPCVAGPQAGAYVTNESSKANMALYAFEPD